MGLLSCTIPVLFFLVSGCALIDSVIVIEPKKGARPAGTLMAKHGSAGDGCDGASGKAPPCGGLRNAENAGYEDGTSLKPITKEPPEGEGEAGAEGQGSEFASLFKKLVKTGMRLYTWPEAK